ncbi:hypothetical protein FHU38_002591 [Saccharomonospora amisosensis]|uniref:3-methyladenine DNA glycosylase n=1 Tax=Saccharomonospora amisosensis TaxID=1128677 RepID=A0A7X5UQX4_9PSEU|nr:3-methyladenine DNA glycosylase [Saccharomonospora amisosensis]NIJ12247.1 hypothetical protein [Saccharomonospora amisosensis]
MRLTERQWHERERAHVERMRRWTVPHRARRSRAEKHPVLDFLFTYYSHPPAHLERWQPGPGVVLEGQSATRFLRGGGYHEVAGGVAVNEATATSTSTAAGGRAAERTLALLEATARRAPRLSCFGLHEWAMVYRESPERLRHPQLPLRLGSAGTDEVLESLGVRCGHFDAFRFFTEAARPLNALRPTRQTQPELDQPGCLHVGMDLYKWAYQLGAFVPAELLGDCFELAADIRELDMRASPYDLSAMGYSPVRIETAEGRAEYARAQESFARRAAPLRARLIECYRTLLTAFDQRHSRT